jgi:putative phage-type endonuclease
MEDYAASKRGKKMKVINFVQGSKEWLEFRKMHVMASDIPVIMGVSPYKTPRQLYDEKMNIGEFQKETASMRYGKNKEADIRESYNKKHGIYFYPVVAISDEWPWMGASYDGIFDEKDIFMEIKCTNGEDHAKAKENIIPEKYKAQIAQQFLVSNFFDAIYLSFHKDEIIELELSKHFISAEYYIEIIEKGKEFYQRMLNFDPPPLIDRDIVKNNSDIWHNSIHYHQKMKMLKKEYEEKEREALEELIKLSEGKPMEGAGFRLEKIVRKGSIQYDLIPELKDKDLNEFRKQSTVYWSIKESK